MKDKHLLKTVAEILKRYNSNLSLEKISINSEENLELDSVDLTNFILDLEENFNIEITESDYDNFSNFKKLFQMLNKKKIIRCQMIILE